MESSREHTYSIRQKPTPLRCICRFIACLAASNRGEWLVKSPRCMRKVCWSELNPQYLRCFVEDEIRVMSVFGSKVFHRRPVGKWMDGMESKEQIKCRLSATRSHTHASSNSLPMFPNSDQQITTVGMYLALSYCYCTPLKHQRCRIMVRKERPSAPTLTLHTNALYGHSVCSSFLYKDSPAVGICIE